MMNDFERGRRIFLLLKELPENASDEMRRGFEHEAAKVRETDLHSYMLKCAGMVGLIQRG